MTHLSYHSKILLGWLCFHLWMAISEWLYDNGPKWLYYWLLSWAGFYAYDTGFDYYREMRR